MYERADNQPTPKFTKSKKHLENLSRAVRFAESIETTSAVELGSAMIKIAQEIKRTSSRSRMRNEWISIKDKAHRHAVKLKASGSKKILIGPGTAPNRRGEPEDYMYFVYLGNEQNPVYVTTIPMRFVSKVDTEDYLKNLNHLNDISDYQSLANHYPVRPEHHL